MTDIGPTDRSSQAIESLGGMGPHQHDIKMLSINATLVARRTMLCQIMEREFRAARCYCYAVVMTVLKGPNYDLRGLRLSQRF